MGSRQGSKAKKRLAKHAAKHATMKKGKRPRCSTCGKAIHVPAGWTAGPAVRRHYWRQHPEVMQTTRTPKEGRR